MHCAPRMMHRLPTALTLACAALAPLASAAIAQQPAARWYRGNTHTHTLNSDGDSPPDAVVRWYRERGYHFVFITDHEFITDTQPLNALFGAAGRFLVLSGQEVTQRVADPSRPAAPREAHVNALGIRDVVLPIGPNRIASDMTLGDTYRQNIAAIREAGGLAQVNHPNFRWSVPLAEMFALPDSTLLEIWNGHPIVYNDGGVDSTGVQMQSTEVRWDSLLSRGLTIWGVADDDSHYFRPEDGDNPDQPRGGRGWVLVRADTLTEQAILSSLRRGEFYSSTGVTLQDYRADSTGLQVAILPAGDRWYRTEFIGSEGRLLSTVFGTRAAYQIRGSEGYVRVRVTDSSGRRAWTQPWRLPRRTTDGESR